MPYFGLSYSQSHVFATTATTQCVTEEIYELLVEEIGPVKYKQEVYERICSEVVITLVWGIRAKEAYDKGFGKK